MSDTILDGSGEQTSGRRLLDGTDLEIGSCAARGQGWRPGVRRGARGRSQDIDRAAALRIEDGEIRSCGRSVPVETRSPTSAIG
jgi:hypothetical protein